MKRTAYRKWYNPDEYSENYLLIYPSGLMLQITFLEDDYGDHLQIFHSNRSNRLKPEIFIKHKEVSTKTEFEYARKKALSILNGEK